MVAPQPGAEAAEASTTAATGDLLPVARQWGFHGRHHAHVCAGKEFCVQFKVTSQRVDTEQLPRAFLDYYETYHNRNRAPRCHGAPCPSFTPCAPLHPTFSACWFDDLNDEDDTLLHAPPVMEFTPQLEVEAGEKGQVDAVKGRKLTEDSASVEARRSFFGSLSLDPFSFQVFLLRDVFIAPSGEEFNATHRVIRNGCAHRMEYLYPKGQPVALITPTVPILNWSSRNYRNFFHFFLEALPSLVVGLRATQAVANLHVFANSEQWERYKLLGKPVLGLSRRDLNALSAPRNSLHFANVVYQPVFQPCGHNSPSFWRWFRRNYLLHPDGLPVFHANRTLRTPLPISSDDSALKLPKDWIVILGRRHGGRELSNVTVIRSLLGDMFGATRLVEYSGSQSIMSARKLFMKARLFIAAHGAGLSNMVFMPTNSTVLEIRPRHFSNNCYRSLAFACGINYHLSVGEGSKKTKLTSHIEDVQKNLNHIKHRFDVEDH